MADTGKGMGKTALLAVLVGSLVFWILVYSFGVPTIVKTTGLSEQVATLIVAACAIAFGIPAMLIGKSMAAKQAAGDK